MKSILIIIDYFGKWPEWFPLFLLSCEKNPTISWNIHTDCPIPDEYPRNVNFFPISFINFCKNVSKKLNIDFSPNNSYRVSDSRTTNGVIYKDEIKNFDYYGYTDLDLIYGNIRLFYNDEILSHNIISTQLNSISGHFTLFNNTRRNRKLFSKIPNWKETLECKDFVLWEKSLDEAGLFKVIMKHQFMPRFFFAIKNYFENQYATPFVPYPWIDGKEDHPEIWYWKEGHITNNLNGEREFLYLHFMNFKYPRFMQKKYNNISLWNNIKLPLVKFEINEVKGNTVQIDKNGFSINYER